MNVRAVILAGGEGRRLYPYTACLPKPLVPMGDRPILEVMVRQLKAAGIRRLTLATGHMAELIMAYMGSGERYGVEIDYTVERSPLGTVGPLRLIEDLDEAFLVMNGDLLTDVSFQDLLSHHRARGAVLTVATCCKPVKLALGVLECDEDGFVTGFQEKPEFAFDVSMGVYVFEPRVLDYVPPDTPLGFDQLMETLLAEGERIATYPHAGAWYDIGSPEDYGQALESWEADPGRFLPS